MVHGPTAYRMRRSVGNPTAAVIRRTCRFLPSTSVSSSQDVGIALRNRIGRIARPKARGAAIACTFAGAVTKSREIDARLECAQLFGSGHPLDLRPIDLGELAAGTRDPRLQRAVGGEDDEPFAVRVEPAGGIHVRNRDEIGKCRSVATRGGELAEHAIGFVEQDDRPVATDGIPLIQSKPRRAVPWQYSPDSRIIKGLPQLLPPRDTIPRRPRTTSGRLRGDPPRRTHVPARQGPGRRPEDHGQQGF